MSEPQKIEQTVSDALFLAIAANAGVAAFAKVLGPAIGAEDLAFKLREAMLTAVRQAAGDLPHANTEATIRKLFGPLPGD